MAGVNKVILLGNLGSDPEVRHLENGSVVARFNIATSEAYTNRSGERVEQTEWHRIELWDNLAKIAEQYLKKGNTAYIEGKLKTETWTNKEGQPQSGLRVRGTALTLVGGSRNPNTENNAGGNNTNDSGASQPVAAPRVVTPKVAEPIPDFGGNSSTEEDLPF